MATTTGTYVPIPTMEELLKAARQRMPFDKHPLELKKLRAKQSFEHNGIMYDRDQLFELSQSEAFDLIKKAPVELVGGGGWADIYQVKRVGKEPLLYFDPWHYRLNPAKDGFSGVFDQIIVRVRHLKYGNLVPGGECFGEGYEFYCPYGMIRQSTGLRIEGQGPNVPPHKYELCSDQS